MEAGSLPAFGDATVVSAPVSLPQAAHPMTTRAALASAASVRMRQL
jgi:hypothetical protein